MSVKLPPLLVVDDEKNMRLSLEAVMAEEGYEIRAVDAAEAALRLLEQEEFFMIITDARLNGMSGYEFLGQLKQRWPNLPVLMITRFFGGVDAALLQAWHDAVPRLRQHVSPDPDGDASGPNYGSSFTEHDYAAIPRRDLPFGVPDFLGDDAAGRNGHPRHNNSVSRPSPDDGHTLIWNAPAG